MAVSREKLFEEVWAEPMTTVAERYGVSSSFLARVCSTLNVPRPERGYWAQLQAGKKVRRPKLPEPGPGDLLAWRREGEAHEPIPLPKAPSPSEKRVEQVRPTRSHSTLDGAREQFESGRVSDTGYLRPNKRKLVDVFVTQATLDRALKVWNELAFTFEKRSHRVNLAPIGGPICRPSLDERIEGGAERYGSHGWSPSRATVVYIGSVAVGLTLFEPSEETDVRFEGGKVVRAKPVPEALRHMVQDWTYRKEMPTGRLALRAHSPYAGTSWTKVWVETKELSFSKMILLIVAEVEAAAPVIAGLVEEEARRVQRAQVEWEEYKRRRAIEQAEERRRAEIKRGRDQLASVIEAWASNRVVEEFFEDIERRASELPPDEQEVLVQQLQRARALAGRTDALSHFRAWKAPEDV